MKNKRELNQVKTVANLIKVRNSLKLTQTKFAKTADVSRTTYCGIENLKVKLTEDYLRHLAEKHGFDPDDVLVYNDYFNGFEDGTKNTVKTIYEKMFGVKIVNDNSTFQINKIHLLYSILYLLGYEIKIIKSKDELEFINEKLSEKGKCLSLDLSSIFDNEYVVLVTMGNKVKFYWSFREFVALDRFISKSIRSLIKNNIVTSKDAFSAVEGWDDTSRFDTRDELDGLLWFIANYKNFNAKGTDELSRLVKDVKSKMNEVD